MTTPPQDQYKDIPTTTHAGTPPSDTVGPLPFTGMDLFLMSVVAVGVCVFGMLLRRASQE